MVDEACATIKVQMDSVPVELDTLTRQIMQLEVEKQALKKEKDEVSKKRVDEIDCKLLDMKEKENKLRSAWEEEKNINDNINYVFYFFFHFSSSICLISPLAFFLYYLF